MINKNPRHQQCQGFIVINILGYIVLFPKGELAYGLQFNRGNSVNLIQMIDITSFLNFDKIILNQLFLNFLGCIRIE